MRDATAKHEQHKEAADATAHELGRKIRDLEQQLAVCSLTMIEPLGAGGTVCRGMSLFLYYSTMAAHMVCWCLVFALIRQGV